MKQENKELAANVEVRPFEALVIPQVQWDWGYARWLVMLRKALKSTGYFEKGVYPYAKSWRWMYDAGFSPRKAVKTDMPWAVVSIYYMTF